MRLQSCHPNCALNTMSVFIVEGHNVAIQNIREAIKLWHLQILWSELNHITVRLHDFNTEREQLAVRLCLCKSKPQINMKCTYLDSKTKQIKSNQSIIFPSYLASDTMTYTVMISKFTTACQTYLYRRSLTVSSFKIGHPLWVYFTSSAKKWQSKTWQMWHRTENDLVPNFDNLL